MGGNVQKGVPPIKLTDTALQNATDRDKPYTLFDGHGLFLLMNPNGRKEWRFKYRFHGKEKLISWGTYPEVSLAKARACRKVGVSVCSGNLSGRP